MKRPSLFIFLGYFLCCGSLVSSSTGVSELPHESMVDFAFASFTQSHGGPGRENGHIDRQLITGPNQLPVIELILQVYILSKMEAYLTYSRVASEITDSMTVFAPWDNSFNRLEESLVRKLRTRSWSAHLQNFIRFHMYDGYLAVDSLPNLPGSFNITMRNGEDIVVTQYPGGRIRVDGVRALASYDATDGFVYILDGVLLPAWLVRSLTDVASSTVSKFTSMIVRAGLEAELSDPNGSLTILAPTDDSFTKIDDILNKVLMQDEGLPILKELLEYHMLPNGPWPSSVFNQPRTFSTLQGENIRIIPGDLPVFQGNFNSASITLFDQVANNGLIHVIDSVLLTHEVEISTWGEAAKIVPPDGEPYALFGHSVAISGDTIVVGAPYHGSGSVYVFVRDGSSWRQEAKLLANGTDSYASFGFAVAIDGDTLAVGANFDYSNGMATGSVYVFVRAGTTWTEQAKLAPDDGSDEDDFGGALAIDGDTLVVAAAYDDNENGRDAGSVYVFVRSGVVWEQQARLLSIDGEDGDAFGWSVAVDSDTVVVGAPNNRGDSGVMESGGAYVFVRSGQNWSFQAKLIADDPIEFGFLGNSVDVKEDIVAVGSPSGFASTPDSGGVYVFRRSDTSWSLQSKLTTPEDNESDSIGWSLSMSQDTIVAGSFTRDFGGGAAYVFSKTDEDWSFVTQVTASDRVAFDRFGWSVDVSGDEIVVGAIYDDDVGLNSGGVYLFEKTKASLPTKSISTWGQEAVIFSQSTDMSDLFGSSVAISGQTIAVGAPGDGSISGSAYILTHDGTSWTHKAKVISGSSAEGDSFGFAVAMDNDTLVVGANQDEVEVTATGSAYVFVKSGESWNQQAILAADDGESDDNFGGAVAVHGDTIVVGATGKDDAGIDSGSVYIFVRSEDTWIQQAKLLPDDLNMRDHFGFSVSIYDDTIVVGAPGSSSGSSRESGSAYIFVRSNGAWFQQARLTSEDDSVSYGFFGNSVAIHKDTVAIGAPGNPGNVAGSGCIYVFDRLEDDWQLVTKLIGTESDETDNIGRSLSMSRDIIVAGSDQRDSGVGAAYVFNRIDFDWAFVTKINATNAFSGDKFGGSVGVSGNQIVIGAAFDGNMGVDSGGIYIFEESAPVVTPEL